MRFILIKNRSYTKYSINKDVFNLEKYMLNYQLQMEFSQKEENNSNEGFFTTFQKMHGEFRNSKKLGGSNGC